MSDKNDFDAFDLSEHARRWLELDESIRLRLEIPHGWTEKQIAEHRSELTEREETKRCIRKLLEP